MSLFSLLDKKVIFFGGKGGVGKTTCASAFSIFSSEKGKKTLLISTDPAHSSSDIFERDLSGGKIIPVTSKLDAIELDPESETDNYINEVKSNIRDVVSPHMLSEIEKQIDLAKISPGAEESALFHRFTQLIVDEEKNYDHLVFDTAPTGHTLRLLTLPELMTVWIEGMITNRKKVGALKKMWENVSGEAHKDDVVLETLEKRRDQFKKARDFLLKKGISTFVFVLTPEKLPILETAKGIDILEKHHIPVDGIIINKILPDQLEGDFFEKRKDQEHIYLSEIEKRFRGKKMLKVPLNPNDIKGYNSLKLLGEHYFKDL